MNLIRKISLLFLLCISPVFSDQNIIIEVEFDDDDVPIASLESTDIEDSMITFGFSPSIFSGIIPLYTLHQREIRRTYLNAKEALKSRKMHISKNKLYTFHVEKKQKEKQITYFLTIATIL